MLTELLPLTSEAVSIHLNMKTKHVGVYSAFFCCCCLFVCFNFLIPFLDVVTELFLTCPNIVINL